MTPLDRWRELTRALEAAKERLARAGGARDRLLADLEDRYGCKSLAEAKRLQPKLDAGAARLEREAGEALDELDHEHGDRLNDRRTRT